MRLLNEQIAPDFSIDDINTLSFELSKPRQKLLLLAFFRYASCPLCNLRVHELIKNYHTLAHQLEIVAVFQSPPEKIKQYIGKQAIPFPILADPGRRLYQLYGVENSWTGFAKAWIFKISRVYEALIKHQYHPGTIEGEIHRIPADFIIDPDNRIIRAYYGNDIGDHLPLADIFSLVKQHEARR